MSRQTPLTMTPEEFRAVGHQLVDLLAERLAAVPRGPVTTGEPVAAVRALLGSERPLPDTGVEAATLVAEVVPLLFEHSLFNAHPRFFGYITSSPAPLGMLGDLLAAALNQNVGASKLSPLATEIEAQTVRWIAEFIGFPPSCGGLLVSGGNMANFVCLLAARAAKAPWNVREDGLSGERPLLRIYASSETHTWLQKAADLSGLGTSAIRWIAVDTQQRIDTAALDGALAQDRAAGDLPFLVVGTAGTVSTGAVDPLRDIAAICRRHNVWFHVDGAYGGLAAGVEGTPDDLRAIGSADSVAVDPHKWLYAPLEAGCALVRDAAALRHAFSYHPSYYHFDDAAVNYNEYGPQNSRGFRALKVWLALRQAGRGGYASMIGDDIRLAQHLHERLAAHAEFEATSQALSITTFRYVPASLRARRGDAAVERQLDDLNQRLLTKVEQGGDAFFSNALLGGRFVLRACIVNFHTTREDIEMLPELVARSGRAIAREMGLA